MVSQPGVGDSVGVEFGVSRIHEMKYRWVALETLVGATCRGQCSEIGFGQFGERFGSPHPTAGVAIPRQIDQVDCFNMALSDGNSHPVDVDEPCLTRSPTCTGQLPANERVNQAGFADIGAADQCDLEPDETLQASGAASARDEDGLKDFHE